MLATDLPVTEIDYTNWRGERAIRQVHIEQIVYKESAWHEGPQWIVTGLDVERSATRDFALEGIRSWKVGDKLITHQEGERSIEEVVAAIKEGLKELPGYSVADQEALVDEMARFGLGQFLLSAQGLNGYWIDYVVCHPQLKGERLGLSNLERFFLEKAPFALATQERNLHFQNAVQRYAKAGMVLASCPCGLMGELVDSQVSDVRMIGIDLDPQSLVGAMDRAERLGLASQCEFRLQDAWALDLGEEVDFITSNGLTIYESDDTRVLSLLKVFCHALKPGGVLVISTLTPPPTLDPESEWCFEEMNGADLALQKMLLVDIAPAGFSAFRSSKKMAEMLVEAGFQEPEVVWDRAHLFPTLIAQKR